MSKIQGVPDGWELVRIGIASEGEWVIALLAGTPYQVTGGTLQRYQPIIRKIEKPKRYRQFANAEEFKPHRDRWVWQESNFMSRIGSYNSFHVWIGGASVGISYSEFFDRFKFEDGTPCGMEIEQ